jgi:cell wall-associated NlpC family hydrolase
LPPGGVVPTVKQAPSQELNALIGTKTVTLREYTLERQVETLESELEKADERVDQKIEQLDAEFEKYETVDALITKLHKYVGKAPYVLSGVGPTGWDCSGLVMWFYKQYKGYYLEHRASAQANGGKVVDAPIPGDIVAFTYNGSKNAYHVGIYVGGGFMIHAKNRGEDTVLESVTKFAAKNSKVAYIRY